MNKKISAKNIVACIFIIAFIFTYSFSDAGAIILSQDSGSSSNAGSSNTDSTSPVSIQEPRPSGDASDSSDSGKGSGSSGSSASSSRGKLNIIKTDSQEPQKARPIRPLSQVIEDEKKEAGKAYVKLALMLPDYIGKDNKNIEYLAKKRLSDSKDFERAVMLANKLIDKKYNKDIFAVELLSMEPKFIERFSSSTENKPHFAMKKQSDDYINAVKHKKPIKLKIDSSKIELLFAKKTSIDKIIEDILP